MGYFSNSEDNNNDVTDEKHINSLLVERVPTTDNKSQVISWMDVSHQAYTMALMITVLEKCFGENYSNPQIQLLSDSIIQFVDYLYHHDVQNLLPKHKIESALMMLQWPLLVAEEILQATVLLIITVTLPKQFNTRRMSL